MRKYRLGRLEPHRIGRWAYTWQRDGSVCLCACYVNRDELLIPDSLLGRPVTALGREFSCGAYVRLAVIPPTVHTIGEMAFAHEESLQAVVIPPTVTRIDETAFTGVPDVVLFVEEGSCAHDFALRAGLEYEVDCDPEMIPDGWEDFTWGPWSCARLDDGLIDLREYGGTERVVEVPGEIDGSPVAILSDYCFGGNDHVEEIRLPEGLASVGSHAFADCPSLRRVDLPDSLLLLQNAAFINCRDLTEVRIPPQVSRIAPLLFHGCASLRTIALPESVTLIGPLAFGDCTALEEVRLSPGLQTVLPSAFLGCPRLRLPALPATLDASSRAALESLCG